MIVWVVEQGSYSDRWVTGVYASLDAAMAANPLPTTVRVRGGVAIGEWIKHSDGSYSNNGYHDDAISITAMEVEGE